MRVKLYATRGRHEFLRAAGLSRKQIDLVINIPKNYQEEEELTNDYLIRLDDLQIKSRAEYEAPGIAREPARIPQWAR